MKCLLPACSLKISEVHVRCPFGVEQLVQLQSVVVIRLEVLIQLFDVQLAVLAVFGLTFVTPLRQLTTVGQAGRCL